MSTLLIHHQAFSSTSVQQVNCACVLMNSLYLTQRLILTAEFTDRIQLHFLTPGCKKQTTNQTNFFPICTGLNTFFLNFPFLLLKPLHVSWREVSQCLVYLHPSVARNGDLVLGRFFSIYYIKQDSDVYISFLFAPKTHMKASR